MSCQSHKKRSEEKVPIFITSEVKLVESRNFKKINLVTTFSLVIFTCGSHYRRDFEFDVPSKNIRN